MSFVPFTPPLTTRRARELAKEIVRTVEQAREHDPRLRDADVDRALQLARSRLSGAGRLLLPVVLAAVLLILAVGLFMAQTGGR